MKLDWLFYETKTVGSNTIYLHIGPFAIEIDMIFALLKTPRHKK
jgi:hypothetical protein